MTGSGLMTIEDLVRSSAHIYSERFYKGQYKQTYTHSISSAITKTMGTIYYNNKVVIYNEDSGILEIRMGMGTKTETAYQGMHAIRMALYGVEGKIYDSLADLYEDQVGKPMDAHDETEMKKAIRGETTIGDRYAAKQASDEREANHLAGRRSSSTGEANRFNISYRAFDPNAVLSGYVIPVAAVNPDTGAYTFKEDGKVFYMEKPITIDTICRVSCSCFTGDTEVILGDGTAVRIDSLVGKENFKVLAYDQENDKFSIANATQCKKYKEDAPLVRVTLDNGKEIMCTPDHNFLRRDGEWVEAQNLHKGDSLRALYAEKRDLDLYRLSCASQQKIRAHLKSQDYYVYVYLDPTAPGEYTYGDYTFTHKPFYVGKGTNLRYKSHMATAKREGHKNRFYTKLLSMHEVGVTPIIIKYALGLAECSALQLESHMIKVIGNVYEGTGPLCNLCDAGTHLTEQGRKRISERMKKNNPMRNKETAKIAHKKYAEKMAKKYGSFTNYMNHIRETSNIDYKASAAKRKAKDPNTYKKMHEGHIKYLHEQLAKGTYHTQSEAHREKMRALWSDPEYRIYMFRCRVLKHLVKFIKECGTFDENKYNKIPNLIKTETIRKRFNLQELLDEAYEKAFHNHKVVKVEHLTQTADVYCITVESLGNFVVATPDNNSNVISGVVVKNCSDYFYTLAWYNYAHGAHLGQQPASYPGKNSMTKTVRNVTQQPGMCKHLMMFTMLLLNGGIISKEGTVNFENNINVLRNRPEKLSISKKLADKGDWNRHLQELNRSLFKADKARKNQMMTRVGNKQYDMTPDGYYDWSKHKVAQRVGKGYKNVHKGLTKDRYTSQGALDTFQQALKMAGASEIEMAKVLGAYGRSTRKDAKHNQQQVDWYKKNKDYKPYWNDL